jgi:K+-sensing histidine kinase KdpD
MTTSYASGDLIPAISRYVEEENVYMIVMGSHGTTELSAKILGSNAQKVIRHAHCPVLVVKREVPTQPFENILFASDFSKESEGPYKWLMEFANRMGAHLHLLYITPYGSKGIPEKIETRMQAFADIYPLKASVYCEKDFELGIGIAHAAEEIKADLISLAHPERSALLRFLTGSVAEELANQLETPVLSLNMPNAVSLEELQEMSQVRRVSSSEHSEKKLVVN